MFWYNGGLVAGNTLELAIDDPGLLYGATVFTTMRVYQHSLDSRLTNWAAHCDRLSASLQAFDWQQPHWTQVKQGAKAMLQYFPILRLTLFPDGREWIIGRELPADLTKEQKYGRAAYTIELVRSLAAHKTGNYLSAWLAQNLARKNSAQEAILVSSSGEWLETSTGNLWGWKDNCWWTPPLKAGILPGIVRSQLINWLQEQNLEVKQKPWQQELVQGFETICYSNSVVEIMPIRAIASLSTQKHYEVQHPALKLLQDLFIE
ncbi:aminotransferase class IV [Synechocystis sp. PCC 7509]|uniref:aminotransferase class IV n=1 Tax=Synechocystis sp. PCC 7509 TaxID=927677 RepID=UPI0002ABC642|nr:aminotransferase class IV [Synechocystis sp. PCC 7509]